MSMPSQAPALSPSHRYLAAALVRLRRFVNRSVADMLAKRERAARQFMMKRLGDRHGNDARRRGTPGACAAMLVLIAASSLSPATAKAEDPIARNHRGGQANQAPRDVLRPAQPHPHARWWLRHGESRTKTPRSSRALSAAPLRGTLAGAVGVVPHQLRQRSQIGFRGPSPYVPATTFPT